MAEDPRPARLSEHDLAVRVPDRRAGPTHQHQHTARELLTHSRYAEALSE